MKRILRIQSTVYPDSRPAFNQWAQHIWKLTHKPYTEAKIVRLKKQA